MLQELPSLRELAASNGNCDGQRVLLGPDGWPDLRVNEFFVAPRMRNGRRVGGAAFRLSRADLRADRAARLRAERRRPPPGRGHAPDAAGDARGPAGVGAAGAAN